LSRLRLGRAFVGGHPGILCLALASLFAFLSARTVFEPGPIVYSDHTYHLANSWYTITELVSRGKILGWDPTNSLGWVYNQYGPGSYAMVALVYYLGAGLVSIVDAYKLTVMLVYALSPYPLYLFLRTFGFSRKAATAAGFFSVVTFLREGYTSGGFYQIWYWGMWAQVLATYFMIGAIALYHRAHPARTREERYLFIAGSAVFSVLSLLTHPMTAGLLAILMGCYSFMFFLESLRFRKFDLNGVIIPLLVFSLVIDLAAFWALPLISTGGYYSATVFRDIWLWNPFTVLWWMSRYMVHPLLIALGILGYAVCIRRWHFKETYVVVCLFASTYLAMGPDVHVLFPAILPFYDQLMFARFLSSVRFFWIALSGVGFGAALDLLGRVVKLAEKPPRRPKPALRSLPAALAAAMILVLVFSQLEATDLGYGVVTSEKKYKVADDFPLWPRLLNLMNWTGTREGVENGTRILYQDTWGTLNYSSVYLPRLREELLRKNVFPEYSHAFSLATMYSGKPMVGSWGVTNYVTSYATRTENGTMLGINVMAIRDEALVQAWFNEVMHELGISYVACFSRELVETLNSTSLMRRVYGDGFFYVFKLRNATSIVEPENGSPEVRIVSMSSDEIVVDVENFEPGTRLRFKTVYYPNWRAYVNGRSSSIETYHTSAFAIPFMAVNITQAKARVVLRFEDTLSYTAGRAITIAGFVVTCAVVVYCLRPVVRSVFRGRRQVVQGRGGQNARVLDRPVRPRVGAEGGGGAEGGEGSGDKR